MDTKTCTEMVRQAVTDQFPDAANEVCRVDPPPGDFVGVITLGRNQKNAVLALAANEEDLRAFAPRFLGDDALDSADWIGELANQVFSAVRRRFSEYGVDLGTSPPVVLRSVRLAPVAQPEFLHVAIRREEHALYVCIDLSTLPLDEASSHATTATDHLEPGASLLF